VIIKVLPTDNSNYFDIDVNGEIYRIHLRGLLIEYLKVKDEIEFLNKRMKEVATIRYRDGEMI